MDDRRIAAIVEQVVTRLKAEGGLAGAPKAPAAQGAACSPTIRRETARPRSGGARRTSARGDRGLFPDVDTAVAAATEAFDVWRDTPMSVREDCITAIRAYVNANAEMLARRAVEETGLGRVDHKIIKNKLAANKTQGTEALQALVLTGDDGMTLIERAAFGVIASITPCTNATETLTNNGIAMMAAGNTVVFNVHPLAKKIAGETIQAFNDCIVGSGGPPNVLNAIMPPTIESAQGVMTHPDVRLVAVTGGGEVVRVAMNSGKRAVAAGPGNPPCVVDATADLDQAGDGIVRGTSFDNCIVCTAEKEIVAVASIADELKASIVRHGGYELKGREIAAVQKLVVKEDRPGHYVPERAWIGKDASKILEAAGIRPPAGVQMCFAEVDEMHPFVQGELLMPVIGFVRVTDVDEAIATAVRVEHGFRHTANMYSRDVDALHRMARAINCSIFVKNAPTFAGLGAGGEGYTAWTIASPTGDGCTNARTWTRERRCTLAQYFHIV